MEKRMPVLFIGHGSPMNAIVENAYTHFLSDLGSRWTRPKAILVISAHWMTRGTWVTSMKNPKTIHDFYGFPKALFDVQYPAPGSPSVAESVRSLVTEPRILSDDSEWGLDHGTWAVLKHMYPEAEIPVLQLSLSMQDPPSYHLKLGEQLRKLREQGILILGSGNIVHNLRQIQWQEKAKPHDWALECDHDIKKRLEARDFEGIMKAAAETAAGRLSVPTPDHYWPLHYILGASDSKDEMKFEYEEIQNASISMLSVSFGAA